MPKGDRISVSAKIPASVIAVIDEIAEADGTDRTAIIGRLLCERLEMEVPSYCRPPANAQTELPMADRGSEREEALPKTA